MVIYNVTVAIDKSIEPDWLQWMKTSHIPKVMKTGFFTAHKVYKVLTQENEESISYAIQYHAVSMKEIDAYLKGFAPALRQEVQDRYGDKQAAFRTLLEEIPD